MRVRSSSDSGSVIGSLIVTSILWILMSIGAIFIKPFSTTKEPDYIEISITLSDFSSQETGAPAVQEIEPEPAPPPPAPGSASGTSSIIPPSAGTF